MELAKGSESTFSAEIIKGARDLLEKYAQEKGVNSEMLITSLLNTNTDERSALKLVEQKQAGGEVILARMGWRDVILTSDEIQEARTILETVEQIARFGYQIPAYVLSRSEDGSFAGIVTTGMQILIREIGNDMDEIVSKWGDQIRDLIPGFGNLAFIKSLKLPNDEKFSGLFRLSSQRIELINKGRMDVEGNITHLKVPAIDVAKGRYGFPPFTEGWARPVKALQFIKFKTRGDRETFETQLTTNSQPLTMLNNLYSVLFSPNMCPNLVSVNLQKSPEQIMKNGYPSGWGGDMKYALNDLAGLGFHYERSEHQEGDEAVFINE